MSTAQDPESTVQLLRDEIRLARDEIAGLSCAVTLLFRLLSREDERRAAVFIAALRGLRRDLLEDQRPEIEVALRLYEAAISGEQELFSK